MTATDTKIQSKGVEPTAPVSPLQQPVTRQQPPTGIVGLQASVGNAALVSAASNGSLGSSSRLFPVQSIYGNAAASRSLQTQRTGVNQSASPPFDTRKSVQRQPPAKRDIMIQPKLTVGAAHDPYEQEADRVAQQVMRMSTPPSTSTGQASVQGQTPEKDETAQTKPLAATITSLAQRASSDSTGSFEPGSDFESRLSTSGGGSPLPASTRTFMEPRFGTDFSAVRLHTGSEAAQLNRTIGAQAFTHGPDVYLGEGKNDLESNAGKQLLAHELTHTIQQGAVRSPDPSLQRERLSEVNAGPIQRDEDDAPSAGAFNVPTLDQSYNTAVQAGRQTGNWQDAAEKLNGFNRDDIQSRLAQLTPDEVGYIHQGALDNPRVGPDSNVAQMTKRGTPRASTAPPSASTAPVAPPAAKSVPVMDSAEKNADLAAIQGLPMYELLIRLSKLPENILDDEEAGGLVGGPRLIIAMRAARAKIEKGLVDFLTNNKHGFEALPPDQAADILNFLSVSDERKSQKTVNTDLEVDITIVAPSNIRLRGEQRGELQQDEGMIHSGDQSSPDAISEFEESLLNDRSIITGVVLDLETREIIGYRTLYADGISRLVDREGKFVVDAGIPLGVESEGLGPGDYFPSPSGIAKGAGKAAAGVAGKLIVKGALKKGVASGGKVTLGAIAKMRGVSRALSAKGIKGLAAGGVKRLVGRTGASAFGKVSFIGLIRNRPLQELTHNEIYNAFKGTAYRLSSHAVMRLKDPRTRALGISTLAHLEQLLNDGIIQESRGLVSIQYGSLEAIVNATTRIVVTISPL